MKDEERMGYGKYQCPKWDCQYPKYDGKMPEYDGADMMMEDGMGMMPMGGSCGCETPKMPSCEMPKMPSCEMPKMKCKTVKECVKTFKCYYKLYRVCQYRLYKVCPRCGNEFDYYTHRGMCPRCM